MTRKIIRWVARILLLTLSYVGFMSVYVYYHGDYPILAKTVQIAWIYGIGGLVLFGLSFVNFKRTFNNFLIWLDGYDRNADIYTRAVSPADNWKGILLILLPIAVIVGVIILIIR